MTFLGTIWQSFLALEVKSPRGIDIEHFRPDYRIARKLELTDIHLIVVVQVGGNHASILQSNAFRRIIPPNIWNLFLELFRLL